MNKVCLKEYLAGNNYPGRGIIIGRSNDNKAYILYFIMGRSTNSRNRIFTETEDGIRTEAFDPSLMTDPSLIIYRPVRRINGSVIVTNGDQTDTIYDFIVKGGSFVEALRTREFEPDSPNYTPRISAILNPDGSYQISILKSFFGDPGCCCRNTFDYDHPVQGLGHIIHTYECDGNPLPSFSGEPVVVDIEGSIKEYADLVWENLNYDNKVSLYACSVDIESGSVESIIYNKNK